MDEDLVISYYFETDKPRRFLHMKIKETNCNIHQLSHLFSEVGESIIHCSFENICIDLSSVSLVTSTIFGICINIVGLAKEHKKYVKFILNSDAMETAKITAFQEIADIEEQSA